MARIVTPESGIPQKLSPIPLLQWFPGMGSAPTVMQPVSEKEESKRPLKEPDMTTTTARKLNFSVESQKQTFAEVVQGNRIPNQGMQLKYYPPIVKDGVKIAQLNPKEIDIQNQKRKTAAIGYVIGGNPSFKEMLKYVNGVWNTVTTPIVL